MGLEYVCDRYSGAVVHVIVSGVNGENSGSGFFCADYLGWIVTAAHVVRNRQILRIMNRDNNKIAEGPLDAVFADEPDLALIRCDPPAGLIPVRVEWRKEVIKPMDRLLVLGYPPIPNLLPNLDHVSAEVRQVTKDWREKWDSLVISSKTHPGSSGGPVLSHRGRAIGVVEQENSGERLGQPTIQAFTAVPTRYLLELQNPQSP